MTVPRAALRVAEVTAGSPLERTLLILALIQDSSAHTLLRPVPIATVTRVLRLHDQPTPGRATRAVMFSAPMFRAWFNSTRPIEANDGAIWQGRGLTAALNAGASIHFRLLSLDLRPLAFVAQNASFTPIIPAMHPDDFGSVLTVEADRPYRFGAAAYARVDPGESQLRFGTRHLGIGGSTASQRWGPAHHFPLVMGTEAAGFPRLFTELRDMPIGLGRIDFQWIVGRLEASSESRRSPGDRSRLATAAVVSVAPHFLPGMQVGASRFFHVRWNRSALTWPVVSLPFVGLLKKSNPTSETASRDYNQLASVFARAAPPGAGIEILGEFYREDHNVDERDLIAEPDHLSAYTLGLRRAWESEVHVHAITVEVSNGRVSHLSRVRAEQALHIHGPISEGHTHLGQPVGSSNLMGGGGFIVAFDRIGTRSSFGVEAEVRRTAQDREGGSWNGKQTGVYALRVGRRDTTEGGMRGIMIGIDNGFGYERGVNVTLSASWTLQTPQ